jgi:putative endonuclease
MNLRQTGALGEKIAVKYLAGKGYRVLHTNYRNSIGEIDIIAMDGSTLVFVEVRSKTGTGFGLPLESITRTKSSKLIRVAEGYLIEHPDAPEDWRIDAIGILFGSEFSNPVITHIPYAIERQDDF